MTFVLHKTRAHSTHALIVAGKLSLAGGGLAGYWRGKVVYKYNAGGGGISGHQEFFFQQSGGQDVFFPSKYSAGYFFPSSLLCRIFFSSKKGHVFTYTKCIYTYIVVIAVIVLIWSCKALKCCKLYKIIIVQLSFRKVILYTHFILRQNKVMHHSRCENVQFLN